MYWSALLVAAGWVLSLCLHEFGHAIVAYWGGDKSVKAKGYLTLNPLKYTDPGLTLLLPIVFLMLGGIALPGAAVYINRRAIKSRLWLSAVSAAGPLASALTACAFATPFMLGMVSADNEALWSSAAILVLFQVVAVILNSLPVPPLDGYGVIEPWLPNVIRAAVNRSG